MIRQLGNWAVDQPRKQAGHIGLIIRSAKLEKPFPSFPYQYTLNLQSWWAMFS
jgi:hypothetical protein